MAKGIARIFINEIEVGSMPRDQYLEIVAEAKKTPGRFLEYIKQFAKLLGRIAVRSARLLPYVIFLIAGILAVSSPELLATQVEYTLSLTGRDLGVELRFWLVFFFLINFAILSGAVALRRLDLGYTNPVDQAIYRRIRSIMEVPAHGSMTVVELEEKASVG